MLAPEWIQVIIIGTAIITALAIEYYTQRLKISPFPSFFSIFPLIQPALPEQLQDDVYELGSGWGGILLKLAKHYPNSTIHGYEQSLLPFFVSWIRVRFSKQKNIVLHRKNFFDVDLTKASLIYCYLSDWHMDKLAQHLPKRHCRLISNTFALKDKEPTLIIPTGSKMQGNIFVYDL